jgi:putative transposase
LTTLTWIVYVCIKKDLEVIAKMPRIARMVVGGEKTAYHIMTRTALDGFPFGDVEKDELVRIIKKVSKLFFVEVFGFSIMSNHFHILAQTIPEHYFSDEDIMARLKAHYGKGFEISEGQIDRYRKKLYRLSNYMKEIKQAFSWYYNKRHDRRGTLWGERFKSVIVENGETLINCLAYIDLNPIRAGLVKRPEDYRWNSIGYHIQTNNKDNFLSMDFGLKEFNVRSKKERVRQYRRYVYEAGALERPEKAQAKVIEEAIVEKARKKDFEITRADRFRCRTRYFSDSGIIGSKEFVFNTYLQFKELFQSRHEKKPKRVKGLSGIYSLKRLAEA